MTLDGIGVTYFRVDYYLQFYIVINHDYKAFKFRSPSAYVGKGGRAGPKKANFKRAGPTFRRAVPGRAAIRKFVNGPGQAEKFRPVQGSGGCVTVHI